MIVITKDHVVDCLQVGLMPAAYCESGETVVFETKDCYDDNDITEENPYGSHPDGLQNPATGPLYVCGAQPGDILKVDILNIELREYGIMRTSVTDGAFHHLYQEKTARIFPFEQAGDGYRIRFDDKLTLDCDIMIGVIGTAPEGGGVLTITPGKHGGNMDCRKIGIGTTLYLPVNTPGALLAIGDLHALMGDGEMMICGLETGGKVTVRVTVLKEDSKTFSCLRDALPLLDAGDRLMTIQSAETLDEAARLAACRMQALMAQITGLDDVNAGMLMSLKGDLIICQIVNPLKTVRCEFPKAILECYSR